MSDGMAPEKGVWRDRCKLAESRVEFAEADARDLRAQLAASKCGTCGRDIAGGVCYGCEADSLCAQLGESERIAAMRCRQAIDARTAQCEQIDESNRLRAQLAEAQEAIRDLLDGDGLKARPYNPETTPRENEWNIKLARLRRVMEG